MADPVNPFANLTITEDPAQPASPFSTPITHPAANIPLPDEQPHPTPTAPAPVKKVGASASYRGMTPGGLATTQKMGSRADQLAQQDINRFQPQMDEEQRGAEDITRQRREGLRIETEAHAEHAKQESELFRAQQHFATEQAELEKLAASQSQIVKQQYLAGYEQDLAVAKQLALQSGDPMETMGGGEAFGLIAAHAVQGFLKVGGMNIDVAGQTDRWINREIAKHGQKVQDARANANDQLHMYDLARQNSSDEYEARERYRGMVLEGMKSQVMMEGSRFNSQLAVATAAQKAAEIDAQLLGVKSNLGARQQKLFFDAEQMRIQQAHQQAQDSVAAISAKADLARAEAAKNKASPLPIRIPDPGATTRDAKGNITGIKNVWQIDPSAPEPEKARLAKAGEDYAQIMAGTAKLRKLRPPAMDGMLEQYGNVFGVAARGSEELRAYNDEKTLTIMGVRHAIAGAQLTPEEKKEWDSILENDSGWQDGSNATRIEQLEKAYRDKFTSSMKANAFVTTIPEGQRDDRAVANEANDTDAGYNAALFPEKAGTGPVQQTLQTVNKVGHNEVTQDGLSPLYEAYSKKNPTKVTGGVGQAAEIDAVDHMVALVAKPENFIGDETVDGKATENPQELRQGAYLALQGLASGKKLANGRAPDPEVQSYAKHVIEQISQSMNADELYNAVATRVPFEKKSAADQLVESSGENPFITQDRGDFLRKGITGE